MLQPTSISALIGAGLLTVLQGAGADEEIDFQLPAGFAVQVLVRDVPNARSMALGDDGTLFVATLRAGKVYAVREAFSGQPAVTVMADGLKMPNGVAFRDDNLYVAERHRILRYPVGSPSVESAEAAVVAELPYKNPLHSWKYIGFGPDGRLYVPLGSPCNVCDEPDFGLLLRMQADGSEREVVTRGIRNTVGFDWHPDTGELWFSDNGRDMLGDELPPDELNRVSSAGQDFGFPYCHGASVSDPEYGKLGSCAEAVAPVQELGPHVAALGMRFYTGDLFPPEYRNQVFIAEHGSWNRSKEAGKTGYRVTLVRLQGNRSVSYEPFMEGFLDGDEVLGRPVDLLIAPDGAMLVSDDTRGVIYRIGYNEDRLH
jgi:glucose/arabinose dehydrogenase